MQSYWNELQPTLQSLGIWGYWVVGLLAFGEALILTSVFAPGTVVVVLAGALAAQGVYDFGDMVWFVAIGTILGAEASYRIGTRGAHLFQEGRRIFSPANLDRGRRFFVRYGAPSIILGHFFGPLRPIIPVVAGLSGMSGRSFFAWNAVGGIAYAVILLSVGYFFGTAVGLMNAAMTRAGLFAIAVVLVAAFLWFIAVRLWRTVPFFTSVSRSIWQATKDNPEVQSLVARHPGLFQFLGNRISRRSFGGLPLTVSVLGFGYFLVLYAGSTWDVVNQNQIVALDVRIASLLSAFRDPTLIRVFTIVTAFGYWGVIAILAVTVSSVLLLLRKPLFVPGLWLALIGNQLAVGLLKITFARPRPAMAVYAESSLSFPSGHSAVSVAFFGFLTYVLIRERIGPSVVSLLLGATLVFLIGLSRIYLLEHYLSDVLNGYLVGALWALLGIWLTEWLNTKRDQITAPTILPWQKLAAIAAVACAAVALWIVVQTYQQTLNPQPVQVVIQLDGAVEAAFAAGGLPAHSEDIFGQPQEPISLIVFAADDAALKSAFSKAGWQLADRPGFDTMARAAYAVWFNGEYKTAPITPAFWNGQPHGFGFEAEAADKSLQKRHHARFWRTGLRAPDGQLIYVGTASFDAGLKWGLTHHIDPNVDVERAYLVNQLQGAGLLVSQRSVQLVAPVEGQNLAGDTFFTDGKAIVLQLKLTASTGADTVKP